MLNTLKVFDLDGTLNTANTRGALDGTSCPEARVYIEASAAYIAREIGLSTEEVFEGLKSAISEEVFPNRAKLKYWGQFPNTEGGLVPVTPAVDHFQLTSNAVTVFLQKCLAQEKADSPLVEKIKAFLGSKWVHPFFKHGSEMSLPHSEMSEDAVKTLDDCLKQNDLVVVITNSTTAKAEMLLRKGGFGEHIKIGGVKMGEIGVVGDAMKFQVDTSMPMDGDSIVDLTPYFGESISLDVRRGKFRRLVHGIVDSIGAGEVQVYSDIPEFDNFPLDPEFKGRIKHGMKVNPDSAPESIAAAKGILNAKASMVLSELVNEVDGE